MPILNKPKGDSLIDHSPSMVDSNGQGQNSHFLPKVTYDINNQKFYNIMILNTYHLDDIMYDLNKIQLSKNSMLK